jgi:hypothetical protein
MKALLTLKGLQKLPWILFITILNEKSEPLGFSALWQPADLESFQIARPLKHVSRNHPEEVCLADLVQSVDLCCPLTLLEGRARKIRCRYSF